MSEKFSVLRVTLYKPPAFTKSLNWSFANANTSAAASGSSKYFLAASGSPTTPNSIFHSLSALAALNYSIIPANISWSS